jgi:hypothetical protein
MFRDPRYLAPLGVLLGVIFVSAAVAYTGSGNPSANPSQSATAVTMAGADPGAQGDATAEPASTPTMDDAAIDARRLRDLTKLRDALLAYRREHGKFPVTKKGITTICASPSDPGCVLASMPGGAPFADGNQPYWFVSDGARVVLVARAQAASDATQCPPVLPAELTGVSLTCLKFERPVQ